MMHRPRTSDIQYRSKPPDGWKLLESKNFSGNLALGEYPGVIKCGPDIRYKTKKIQQNIIFPDKWSEKKIQHYDVGKRGFGISSIRKYDFLGIQPSMYYKEKKKKFKFFQSVQYGSIKMKDQELRETMTNKRFQNLWKEENSVSQSQREDFTPYYQQENDDDEEDEKTNVKDGDDNEEESDFDKMESEDEQEEIMSKKNQWDDDEEDDEDNKKTQQKNTVIADIQVYESRFMIGNDKDDLDQLERDFRVDKDYINKLRTKDQSIQRKIYTTTDDSFYYLRDKFMRMHNDNYKERFTIYQGAHLPNYHFNLLMVGNTMTKQEYKNYKKKNVNEETGLFNLPAKLRDKYLKQQQKDFDQRRNDWLRFETLNNTPQLDAYNRKINANKKIKKFLSRKNIKTNFKVNKYGFKSDLLTIEEKAERRQMQGLEESEEEEDDSWGVDSVSVVKKKKRKKKSDEVSKFKDQLKDLQKLLKTKQKDRNLTKQRDYINKLIEMTKNKIKEAKKRKREKRKELRKQKAKKGKSEVSSQKSKSYVSAKSQLQKSIALSQTKSSKSKKKVQPIRKIDRSVEKMISDYKEEVNKKTIEQSYDKFVSKEIINGKVQQKLFEDNLVNTSNILKDIESNKSFEMELSQIEDKMSSIEATQKELEDLVNADSDEDQSYIQDAKYKDDDEENDEDEDNSQVEEFQDGEKENKEKVDVEENSKQKELRSVSTTMYQSGMAAKMEEFNVDLGLDEFSDEDTDD